MSPRPIDAPEVDGPWIRPLRSGPLHPNHWRTLPAIPFIGEAESRYCAEPQFHTKLQRELYRLREEAHASWLKALCDFIAMEPGASFEGFRDVLSEVCR